MSKHSFTVGAAAIACLTAAAGCHRVSPSASESARVTKIAGVGLNQPENLVYDSVADLYYVSNMGPGAPDARDDNGYISQVSPDGRVLRLRWIAGGQRGATLDAPKGIAICGDTLVVADVGAVHLFNRQSGASIRSIDLPGVMMNDVACAPDGSLWVTDTGPTRGPSMDTTKDLDAVWRIDRNRRVSALARGLALGGPDGIVVDAGGTSALVSTFDSNRIERVTMTNTARVFTQAVSRPRGASNNTPTGGRPNSLVPVSAPTVTTLPGAKVDGLRRLPDSSLVVTSWDAHGVFRLGPTMERTPLLSDVTSPAGVAVDTRRHRLAVTSMQTNTMYLLPLP